MRHLIFLKKKLFSSRKVSCIILFLISVFCAYYARTLHYEREAERLTEFLEYDFVPFTVESAMMYGYSKDIAEGKGIPESDSQLAGMKGISPKRQMSISMEYFLGWGYRIKSFFFPPPEYSEEETVFEDNPDFSKWIRFQIRLWTSLTTGFIFLFLILLKCPRYLAFSGSLIHAFSVSAIARYTGQDLVRGEFALPLLMLAVLLIYRSYSKKGLINNILLVLIVYLAFASWDMSQIFFSFWAIFEILRILTGGIINDKRQNTWILFYSALILSAVTVPYNLEHSLISSPLTLVLMPSLIIISFKIKYFENKKFIHFIYRITIILCISLIWFFIVQKLVFSENYSHFGELIYAKLKHWNSLPGDPRLLSFDARILWTPSMHSLTWPSLRVFMPLLKRNGIFLIGALYIFIILLINVSVFKIRKFKKHFPRIVFPLFMTAVYFISFIYIFRYHVFCILFLSICLPLTADINLKSFKNRLIKFIIITVLIYAVYSEIYNSVNAYRQYRISKNIKATAELIKWFRAVPDFNKIGVLADFELSPLLKSYCGAKILLQPKFEMGKTRKNYERFINAIYHGDETDLNKICVENNLDILVFNNGYKWKNHLSKCSPQYIAASMRLKRDSPAHIMPVPKKRDKLQWFYRIEAPKKYRKNLKYHYSVFKVIKPQDKFQSMNLCSLGRIALSKGKLKDARKYALASFFLDPNYDESYKLFFRVFNRIPELSIDSVIKFKSLKKK